jgi:hypothetical protein
MRMIQSGDGAGFEFESAAKVCARYFEGNHPAEARVARFPHFGHASSAELALDFIRAEPRARDQARSDGCVGSPVEHQIGRGRILRQQRLDLFSEIFISAASVG